MNHNSTMKLIGALTSPYVRKVRIVLAEKKLDYQFELEDVWNAETILKANPLGKVPCLVLEGGEAVFDSRVIVEYLDTRSRPAAGISLPTGDRVSRYSTMTRESKIASLPSITRQGTLPSGLALRISSLFQTSSSTRLKSSFFSAITMRTLRT